MRLVRPDELLKAAVTVTMMVITRALVAKWEKPDFQRLLVENKNLESICCQIQDRGRLRTTIYLGVWEGRTYLIDGQYRICAYIGSGLASIEAPVVTFYYEPGEAGFKEMCTDFIELNGHVRKPTANDMLKAFEGVNSNLKKIASKCPFVGYIKRKSTPLLMAATIRSWMSSASDAPGGYSKGALDMARDLHDTETNYLIDFLCTAHEAWGGVHENKSLWAGLNLVLCMWLYRKLVLAQWGGKSTSTTKGFSQFLKKLRDDSVYRKSLVGKNGKINKDTRTPAYAHMIRIFGGGKRRGLPIPEWYSRSKDGKK